MLNHHLWGHQRFPTRLHEATSVELLSNQMRSDLFFILLLILLLFGLFFLLISGFNDLSADLERKPTCILSLNIIVRL